jgi:hypothetical protein
VRSSANVAAPSVDARIAPSSSPSSVDRSKSDDAARPQITAVMTVPTSASEIAVGSTGRTSSRPDVRPPSNRMTASAMIPTVRARR